MEHDPYTIYEKPKPFVSNATIVIVAVGCVGTLTMLILMFLGFVFFRQEQEVLANADHAEQNKNITEPVPETVQTIRLANYDFELPIGYELISDGKASEEKNVWRYRGEEKCHFIFAVLEDPKWDRFTSPPSNYAEALIPEMEGLNQEIGAELLAERVSPGGLPASSFRFFQRETFRGVEFTSLLVAMDRGTKVVMKFGGKYGSYHEGDENAVMPEHWRTCLLSLRRVLPGQ